MNGAPPPICIVAAVIRDDAGRVLLVRKRGAAVFQQPGGKRDPADADDLATLARELREELGVALAEGSARFLCRAGAPAANEPGHWVEGEVYEVAVHGEARARGEIEALCWVDPADPGALPIARLSREHILPRLGAAAAAKRRRHGIDDDGMSDATCDGDPPRGAFALGLLALCGIALFAGFVALGTWQVHRLAWKRALIARVDARVHAPPVAAPGRAQWPQVAAATDEYRHVRLRGRFLYDRQTFVWAATDDGSGLWAMTPLRRDDGSLVLVNRGFVPPDWCGRTGRCAPGPAGEVTVTGLLRMSEPPAFLRRNDPGRDDWYTRDVAAIATRRGLGGVAPYFVDQDAAPGAGAAQAPRGGLTVVRFPNNHLSYLLTWYAMALMVLAAAFFVGRAELRRRRGARAVRPGDPRRG